MKIFKPYSSSKALYWDRLFEKKDVLSHVKLSPKIAEARQRRLAAREIARFSVDGQTEGYPVKIHDGFCVIEPVKSFEDVKNLILKKKQKLTDYVYKRPVINIWAGDCSGDVYIKKPDEIGNIFDFSNVLTVKKSNK